jgi:hypothetical protein
MPADTDQPEFITPDPASNGRIMIHMSIGTPAELRRAAAWLMDKADELEEALHRHGWGTDAR